MLNPDFRDILSAFSDEQVEYMVVGAYALAAYGYIRATGDLDLWIRRSEDNSSRVWRALTRFGAPMSQLNIADLQSPGNVFQIGVEPGRIDVLTSIDGVDFDQAQPHQTIVELEGLTLPVIGRADLVRNKKASGRPVDQADLAWLEPESPPT